VHRFPCRKELFSYYNPAAIAGASHPQHNKVIAGEEATSAKVDMQPWTKPRGRRRHNQDNPYPPLNNSGVYSTAPASFASNQRDLRSKNDGRKEEGYGIQENYDRAIPGQGVLQPVPVMYSHPQTSTRQYPIDQALYEQVDMRYGQSQNFAAFPQAPQPVPILSNHSYERSLVKPEDGAQNNPYLAQVNSIVDLLSRVPDNYYHTSHPTHEKNKRGRPRKKPRYEDSADGPLSMSRPAPVLQSAIVLENTHLQSLDKPSSDGIHSPAIFKSKEQNVVDALSKCHSIFSIFSPCESISPRFRHRVT